jgi:hypothetical protein
MGTRKNNKKSNKTFRKSRSKKNGGSGKRKRGTDPSEVKTPKKSKTISENPCPICLDELKNTDNIPKLPCKHKFHKECLMHVCNNKNNRNVKCPICRGDISLACRTYITRDTPWVYNPYTSTTPYSVNEIRDMSHEERRQIQNEERRNHTNWLARRRRTMKRETPDQLTQRTQIEQDHWDRVREERARYFGSNDPPLPERRDIVRINSAERRDRLLRGLPLPESPYVTDSPDGPPPPPLLRGLPLPQAPPDSPEGPPPPYIPDSPDGPPPPYIPDSPDGPPPP